MIFHLMKAREGKKNIMKKMGFALKSFLNDYHNQKYQTNLYLSYKDNYVLSRGRGKHFLEGQQVRGRVERGLY